MGSPVRFFFDNDFSAPPPEVDLPDEEDFEEEVPKIELDVHLAELRKAENSAYERGVGDGQVSAVALAQDHVAKEAARVAEAADRMIAMIDEDLKRIQRDAVALCDAIARKLAGHLIARYPDDRILSLIEECLAPLRSVRHLAIRVNEADAASLKDPIESLASNKGFEGRLLILGEPDIESGDCRIEWADGGVLYEWDTVSTAIEDAVREFLGEYAPLVEAEAPPETVYVDDPPPVFQAPVEADEAGPETVSTEDGSHE